MTPFKIKWLYEKLPPGMSSIQIARLKKLYFEDAGKQWNYVVKGWPMQSDGSGLAIQLPDGKGPLQELEITVTFEVFRGSAASAVARVLQADLRRTTVTASQPFPFPYKAKIRVDLNDLQELLNDRERFFDTVVHEIGHVLGIGMSWNSAPGQSLIRNDATGAFYVGLYACTAYAKVKELSGRPDIPLDKEYLGSTPAYHWSEQQLPQEIMSPVLDDPTIAVNAMGGSNVISDVSVGALLDLGYEVNPTAAQPLPE